MRYVDRRRRARLLSALSEGSEMAEGFDGKTNPRAKGDGGGGKPRDLSGAQPVQGRGPGWLAAAESRQQQAAEQPYDLDTSTIPEGGKDLMQTTQANGPANRQAEFQTKAKPFRVS